MKEIIIKYEPYNQGGNEDNYIQTNDIILLFTAIPFLGTLLIMFYFAIRKKKCYMK